MEMECCEMRPMPGWKEHFKKNNNKKIEIRAFGHLALWRGDTDSVSLPQMLGRIVMHLHTKRERVKFTYEGHVIITGTVHYF